MLFGLMFWLLFWRSTFQQHFIVLSQFLSSFLGLGFSSECSNIYQIPNTYGLAGTSSLQDHVQQGICQTRLLLCVQVSQRGPMIMKIYKLCDNQSHDFKERTDLANQRDVLRKSTWSEYSTHEPISVSSCRFATNRHHKNADLRHRLKNKRNRAVLRLGPSC